MTDVKVINQSDVQPNPSTYENDVVRAGMRTLYEDRGGVVEHFDQSINQGTVRSDHSSSCKETGASVYIKLLLEPTDTYDPDPEIFCCLYILLKKGTNLEARMKRYITTYFNGVAESVHTFYDQNENCVAFKELCRVHHGQIINKIREQKSSDEIAQAIQQSRRVLEDLRPCGTTVRNEKPGEMILQGRVFRTGSERHHASTPPHPPSPPFPPLLIISPLPNPSSPEPAAAANGGTVTITNRISLSQFYKIIFIPI